jgi:RluA family pseudouridine synthase
MDKSAAKHEIEIIYEDAEIVVINKPSGLSATRDRRDQELMPILQEQLGQALLLIHRLDKDTSGVMILAKNTDAQRKFSGYFSKNRVKKTYLAFVRGASSDYGTIDAPIGPDHKNVRMMRIDYSKHGKKAVTNWRLIADFGGLALVAVQPVTGRTHQIRVHMPASGMPLAVDPLYGTGEGLMLSEFKPNYHLGKHQEERPLIERLTLHAYQLELLDPQPEGRPNVFVASMDKKFAAAFKMLTKHNPHHFEAFRNQADFQALLDAKPLEFKALETPEIPEDQAQAEPGEDIE